MYLPDYKNSILNLMASIAEGYGKKTDYPSLKGLNSEEIKKADNVILIVLDGLGYEYLTRFGGESELKNHLKSRITSIFPAATTSCVPAFLTGTSAGEHGMTGWYVFMKEVGMIVVPLRHQTRFGDLSINGKLDIKKLYNLRPFSNLLNVKSYCLNPKEFYNSPFNVAVKGRAKLLGYNGIKDMFGQIGQLAQKKGKKYVYAYHPCPDKLIHEYGNEHKRVLREFKKIDREFKKMLEKMKGTNTIVIVTADHGLLTVPKKKWIDTAKYPELNKFLRIPMCGESRLAYLYVKTGRAKEFEEFMRKKMSFCCDVIKSKDAIKQGWFGRQTHHELKNRIGDYMMIMKEDYGIKDFMIDADIEDQHIGRHGGVSKEEVFVPLIIAKS